MPHDPFQIKKYLFQCSQSPNLVTVLTF